MFFAFNLGYRTKVAIKEEGEFFCLQCNAARSFQRRTWERAVHVFFFPVGGSAGEFVLCMTCTTTFTLECLDESSTAYLEEILATPPAAAMRLDPRAGRGVGAYSPGRRH